MTPQYSARWHLAPADSQRLTTAVAWQLSITIDGKPAPGVTVFQMAQPTDADARRIVRRLQERGMLPATGLREAA